MIEFGEWTLLSHAKTTNTYSKVNNTTLTIDRSTYVICVARGALGAYVYSRKYEYRHFFLSFKR